MPDAAFDDPRLARLYDAFEGDRVDLDAYDAIAIEFGASDVLDIGCGTGQWACRLARRGVQVVGVDPAKASLDIARAKPGADRVRWVHGDATSLPPLQVDLVVMTGNVAQVFVDDGDWKATLRAAHDALRPGGHLVVETRDPARQAWTGWNRDRTFTTLEVECVGDVETWVDVTEVAGELVSFRWTFRFVRTGEVLVSDSTLRFRTRDALERSFAEAGFAVLEVRDAPDRPGLEWVFIAQKPG